MPNDKNTQNTGEITVDELLGKLKKHVDLGKTAEIDRKNVKSREPDSDSQSEDDFDSDDSNATDISSNKFHAPELVRTEDEPTESNTDIDALMAKFFPKTGSAELSLDEEAIEEKPTALKPPERQVSTTSNFKTADVPLTKIIKTQPEEQQVPPTEDILDKDIITEHENEFDTSSFSPIDDDLVDPFADEENAGKKSLFGFGKSKVSKVAEPEPAGFDYDVTAETAEIDDADSKLAPNPDADLTQEMEAFAETQNDGNEMTEAEERQSTKLIDLKNLKIFGRKNRQQDADDQYANELTESFAAEDADVSAEDFSPEEADDTDTRVMDKSDINLMMALGLDEELERSVGVDKVSELEAELEESTSMAKKYVPDEYFDRGQTKKIANAYRYAEKSTKTKLLVSIVFALILLVYENIQIIGQQFGGFNDPAVYPTVYIMIDLQITLLCAAMAYTQIFRGFSSLFKGKPVPESITAIMVLGGIIHSVVMSIYSYPPYEPKLYNFPVAFCVVMTLVFSLLNIKREIFSFNIVSTKRPKYALTKLSVNQSKLEAESFKNMLQDGPDILKIEKAGFIDGYFTRTTKIPSYTYIIAIMIPVILAAAALLFALSIMRTKDMVSSFTTAYITMLLGFPLSMFFTYSYPFYKANKSAYDNDSTIVGESSLEDYSDASVISFDDKNVFPAYGVKIQNLAIPGNGRLDVVLYYAASVFSKVGGPLADVFEVATIEVGHSNDVKILSSDKGFLEATVNGRNIILGNRTELEKLGIYIPAEAWEEDKYAEDGVSIMYMIRNGVYLAKMYVKYIIDADFEFILEQLSDSGMCVGIKTFDPNIDEEMIGRMMKLKKYPLKVLRCTNPDEVGKANERIDSGIVTRGTTKSLLQTVSFCDKILQVRKTNAIIKIFSIIVSLIIVWLISTFSNYGFLMSAYITLYQIFWLIPTLFTTKMFI